MMKIKYFLVQLKTTKLENVIGNQMYFINPLRWEVGNDLKYRSQF